MSNGVGTVHTAAVTEIIERTELTERGLSDPLEQLYQTIPDMSEKDKVRILAFLSEYEGQNFEVQCRLFASYAGDKRLKKFVEQYNGMARERQLKTVSYAHAKDMSRIGKALLQNGLRMTRDFPSLAPSYFIIALRAESFVDALYLAQEKVADHEAHPDIAESFSTGDFKRYLGLVKTAKPQGPQSTSASAAGNQGESRSSESPESASAPGVPSPEDERNAAGVVQNCYDCRFCGFLSQHQRLAIVNVKGTQAIDMVDQKTSSAWYCRKRHFILSVRAQNVSRAEQIASECPDFVGEDQDEIEERTGETVLPEGEGEEQRASGPALSQDELEDYLESSEGGETESEAADE